jgi:hypothetical protein
MDFPFHYKIKVKLVRFIQNDKIDFIQDEITFTDKNPIIAREKAIDYYNGYIDTLLEPNLTHDEIQTKLRDKIKIDYDYIGSYFNGIGIFLIIDNPIDDDKIGEEYFIHGFGFGINGTSQSLMDSLNFEMNYYDHYNCDKKDYQIKVNYYEAEADEVYEETILKTPFDWTGYDVPYVSKDEIENDNSVESQNVDLSYYVKYIEEGEGNQIEFKSSLLSFKNGDKIGYSKHVVFKIVKAIASFLNSNGGILYIGVKDDKSILGLDSDFSLTQSKEEDPKDYFKKQVDYIIKNNFKPFATFIKGDFVEVDGKLIFVFIVEPSNTPVFIHNNTDKDEKNHKKEFYVRLTGASSIHYYDIEEIVDYCLNHWRK